MKSCKNRQNYTNNYAEYRCLQYVINVFFMNRVEKKMLAVVVTLQYLLHPEK